MPAGRIFPNKVAESLGSPLEIQTIDANLVGRMMKELEGRQASVPVAPFVKQASRRTEDPVPRLRRAEITGDCEECGVPHPCSHDIYAAQEAGDEAKILAFKEIRKQRRVEASRQIQEEADAERELIARSEARREMFAALDKIEKEKGEQLLDAVKTAGKKEKGVCDGTGKDSGGKKKNCCSECGKPNNFCKCDGTQKGKCKDDDCEPKMKSVAEFSSKERQKFASYLTAMGFPEPYIKAQLTAKVSLPESIVKVASSDIDMDTKKVILAAQIKEAKLDDAQKQRFLSYWKNDLEYQDTEWIEDAVKEPSNTG